MGQISSAAVSLTSISFGCPAGSFSLIDHFSANTLRIAVTGEVEVASRDGRHLIEHFLRARKCGIASCRKEVSIPCVGPERREIVLWLLWLLWLPPFCGSP